MNFEKYEDEIAKYVEELYEDIKEDINSCNTKLQLDEVFKNEKIRVQDFMKYLERSIKIDLKNEGKLSLTSLEATKVEEYYVPEPQVETSEFFNRFENKQKPAVKAIVKKDENSTKKRMIIIGCPIIAFIIGYIIKGSFADAALTAAVGLLGGIGIVDVTYGDKSTDFEKLAKQHKESLKKMNNEKIDSFIQSRKTEIKALLVNFLNNYKKRVVK